MAVKGKNNYQEYKGIKFKNETELEFYQMLEKAKSQNKIHDFEYEVKYAFFEGGKDYRGKNINPITHTPDFKVWTTPDDFMIVDTKGGGANMIDEIAQVKAKILQLTEYPLEYYMISKMPKYLGGQWVEVSKGYDFLTKVKNKYKNLFPSEVKKHWSKKRSFLPNEWECYFDFHSVLDMFYVWDKTLGKKEIASRLKERGLEN